MELKYFLNSVLLQATIAATNRKIAAKDNKTAKLRRESEVRDLDLQVIKETIIRTLTKQVRTLRQVLHRDLTFCLSRMAILCGTEQVSGLT